MGQAYPKAVKGTSKRGTFTRISCIVSGMEDPRFTIGLLLITIGFCVILLLLLLLARRRRTVAVREGPPAADPGPEAVRPCPLCGTMLKRGERVKTTVYSGTPDSMAHIFGCPYCYPPSADTRRTCPVCKKEVADDGFVVARMFDGKEKKHVHVLGCTGCRKVR